MGLVLGCIEGRGGKDGKERGRKIIRKRKSGEGGRVKWERGVGRGGKCTSPLYPGLEEIPSQ